MIARGPREVADPADGMRLREVEPGDAERLYEWRMEPSARAMFRHADVVPFAEHRTFLERYFRPDCRDRWFVIEAEGRPIGAIALYDISADGREAEWGRFVIAPEARGRGRGRRALELLVAHAREIGVRRLRCEVLAGNAARALYHSVGFLDDGSYEHDGRRLHRLVMDLQPLAGEPVP